MNKSVEFDDRIECHCSPGRFGTALYWILHACMELWNGKGSAE